MPKCGFNKVSHGNFYALIQVSLRIQSECGKIRTRKNSVFGHFSCSVVTLKCVVMMALVKMCWVLLRYPLALCHISEVFT